VTASINPRISPTKNLIFRKVPPIPRCLRFTRKLKPLNHLQKKKHTRRGVLNHQINPLRESLSFLITARKSRRTRKSLRVARNKVQEAQCRILLLINPARLNEHTAWDLPSKLKFKFNKTKVVFIKTTAKISPKIFLRIKINPINSEDTTPGIKDHLWWPRLQTKMNRALNINSDKMRVSLLRVLAFQQCAQIDYHTIIF